MVRFGPLGASVTVTLPPPGDDDAPAPSADRHDRARRPPTALDDDALLRALDDDGDDASSSAVRVRRGLILQSEIAYFRGARGADVLRGERLVRSSRACATTGGCYHSVENITHKLATRPTP